MGFYFNFFLIIHDKIIVFKDVCRSKTALKVSVALPLEGRRVVLKLMGLARTEKKEEDQ